ncbi:MAG: hypothetical protein GY768_26140 [Planctomycetaceae bacterium]|nr:hypothetical protein [Planctomycetaceae bacterium]
MMKEKDKNSELDALINACLDGRLSEAEADRLSQWIEESSEARQRYWQLASVHGMIEQSMQSASLKAATGEEFVTPVKTVERFRWSRISSTAAGMLIGIFGASMVWAYAVPRVDPAQRESREIVFESFEDPEMKFPRRFPTSANRWFGGMRSVPGQGGMPAVEGARVGQFANVPQHRFSDVRYIVDLDEYGEPSDKHTRSIEVSGSFFSPDLDHTSVFRIDVAAFSEAPEAVQPVWIDREHFNDVVLQRVGRNYRPEPGDQATWHEVKVSMEIPRGARSLVVSLNAGKRVPGGASSDRYLDAVRVNLVDTFVPVD